MKVASHSLAPSPWFTACAIVAAGSLVTANIVAVKLVSVFGFVVPGGAVAYPLSFIVGDVVTEVYGYRAARRVIWLGFAANVLFVTVASVVQVLPPAPYWDGQQAYERILGYTPRLLAGAFVSYLVGDFANSVVMSRMKVWTDGRALWSRTIASTVIGQCLDSLIFVTIAFGGTITWGQLANVILTVWIFKSCYEAAVTPLTYLAVGALKRVERLDTYDHSVDYNPFSLK